MLEWYIIGLLTLAPLLWMVGGTCWKPARRYILPVILSVFLALCGVVWYKWLLIALISMVAFSMGYGETKSWPYKFGVGCLYVAPSLLLGLTPWQIIVPVAFITTFYLSNYKKTAKHFTWKICEGMTGFLIACNYATLVVIV